MPPVVLTSHPLPSDLRQFALGLLPSEHAGPIEEHVADCRSCWDTLQQLPQDDPLVDGLRAAHRTPTAPPAATLGGISPPNPARDSIGDYELIAELSRGGMGVVYKARQRSLNRFVALKMILAGQLATKDEVERFRREAEAAATLDHPNIVPVYEVGEHRGQHFFSMKLMKGGTLAEHTIGRPQDPVATAWLLVRIARAVHHAHQRGILHRDLKPGNILLQWDENDAGGGLGSSPLSRCQPHVTDFGLAKRLAGHDTLTRTGMLVGTPAYMAPEQAAGGTSSVAADVYSLGAILYELLAGRPPFAAASWLETLELARTQEPGSLRQLRPETPRDLETICLHCLRKEPEKRYASVAALADDLERFLAHEPIAARRVAEWERVTLWARRRPAIAGLLVLAIVGLVGGTIVSTFFAVRANAAARANRELAHTNGELARSNGELASRNARLAETAQDERVQATLRLADSFAERGLDLASQGREREALLWFAHAASRSHSLDAERTRRNVQRYQRLQVRLAHPVAVLPNKTGIERLNVHPSGKYLLVRTHRGYRPMLWNVVKQQQAAWPAGVPSDYCLAWSPDGRWLATGDNGHVKLLPFPECLEGEERREPPGGETPDGPSPHIIPAEPGPVRRIEFDPTGRLLAFAKDKAVRIWDRRAEAFIGEPLLHANSVKGFLFDAGLRRFVTFDEAHRFHVFELSPAGDTFSVSAAPILAGQHLSPTTWTHRRPCFLQGGDMLVTSPDVSQLQLWNLRTKQAEASIPSGGQFYSFVPLNAAEVLVGGNTGNSGVGGWAILSTADPKRFQVVRGAPSHVGDCLSVAYCPATDQAFFGSQFGENQLWSVRQGRPVPCSATRATGCLAAAWSSDGRWLATADYNREIVVWEFSRDSRLTNREMSSDEVAADPLAPRIHEGGGEFALCLGSRSHRCDFSADSRWLAVTEFGGTTSVYDLRSLQRLATLPVPPSGRALKPYFLANADRLAVYVSLSDKRRRVDVWNWRTGERVQDFELPITPGIGQLLPELSQTPDRRHLIAPCDEFVVRLTANDEGHVTAERLDPAEPIERLGISRDGRFVAGQVRKRDSVVHQYEFGVPASQREFPHGESLRGVAYSPDSRRLATCGTDQTVKVWEAATGKLLVGPLRHSWWVYSTEFSSDGRHLLTFGKDAAASLWDLSTGDLVTAPFRGERDILARFRPGRDEVLIADAYGWLHFWDGRHAERQWPALRLASNTEELWLRARTLTLSPDGRFAAVGGTGALQVVDLAPLDDRRVFPTANLIDEAELLSGYRLLPNGQPARLTGDEWRRRFEASRTSGTRGGSATK